MRRIAAIYADGGVIGSNPSSAGGTFAWCQVDELSERIRTGSGYVYPVEIGMPHVTNNVTELWALVAALESLPEGWAGTVYSDSHVSLLRLFKGASLNNVPTVLCSRMGLAIRRVDLKACTYVLLDGHPTKDQLVAGKGKRGNPVSVHNKWCDQECGRLAKAFSRLEGQQAQSAVIYS